MSDWEPATDVEAAMRDALRAGDQGQYFRLLARTDLILPMGPDAAAGRVPMAWGTWATDSRTHVLAFTSPAALDACLAEHAGSFRTLPFAELAAVWPDQEWWLAVNPGLPIEGYLPPWFVAQVGHGDVRLPGRTLGARARVEQAAMRSHRPDAAALTSRPSVDNTPWPREGRALSRRVELLSRYDFGHPGRGNRMANNGAPEPDVPDHVGATHREAAQDEATERLQFADPTPDPTPDATPDATSDPTSDATSDATSDQSPVEIPDAPQDQPGTEPEPALDFVPANRVEESLLDAAADGSTDSFLSTLLLAKVLVPGAAADVLADIDRWHTEEIDGQKYVVVFTSTERLGEHLGEGHPASWIKFTQLINAWPGESRSFAVNPGTPIGAALPGSQIVALATWATGEGLTDEQSESEAPATTPEPPRRDDPPPPSTGPVIMQKTIPASQLPYYLDRGYDRVSGFVHRASEVEHLRTPAELYEALGLGYPDSPFKPDDAEVYVVRWAAHRGNLYRIPYGGQNQAAMQAMQGWVIERSPFRGNGFAPSESRDVIAEFKVDSVRLPHGAELRRVDRDGGDTLVATFDADGPRWRRVDEQ